jgi:hypothetical protein
MAGEPLRSTQIDPRGVAGDRLHYASGPAGRLTQDDLPVLATWGATFPFNPDGAIVPANSPPYPVVVAPDGVRSFRWGDPRLGHALERSLGQGVELVRDLDAVRGVIVATVSPELDPEVAGINVHLELALPAGGWAGRDLLFGDGVRLRLVVSRADGPGIEARVMEAGRIAVNEPVTLG